MHTSRGLQICTHIGHTAWAMILIVITLLVGGCTPPRAPVLMQRDLYPPPAVTPAFEAMAARHNRYIQDLDRLWIRTSLSLVWTDPDGSRRFERADDSRLIFDLPHNMALAVSSSAPGIGTLLWAGSDSERYWLFDLQNEPRVWWGHHRNIGKPCAKDLGLPMQPRDTPRLLALLPIDETQGGWVWWDASLNAWIIEPATGGYRVVLERETAFPLRVDLIDSQGRSRMVGMLHTDRDGLKELTLPPRRADIFMLDAPQRITLEMREVDRSPSRRKVNASQFDMKALIDTFKPGEIFQLDQDCP